MKRKARFLLIGLAYLSFISLGLPDGLLGVAWPSIRAFFNLQIDAIGSLLVMSTTGYLLSSFMSGRILSRINVGSLLALSCAATATSLLGYSIAPVWWVMVGLAVLAGLGAGAIDAGLNTFAATNFSARTVNWLHAFYGVGAATGPMIMTGVLAAHRPWQWGYWIVGAWQLALAICFGLTHRLWPSAGAARDRRDQSPHAAASNASTLRLPVVWLSLAVFFIYTGLEAAAGTWAYSLFTEARQVRASTAGICVSVYWGCLTAGRLVSGVIVGFAPVRRVLRFSMLGILAGASLIWIDLANPVSFAGLALIGLSCAPIFPSLIAATPARLGSEHAANAVGFQIAAAVLGQSLLPAAAGIFASRFGLNVIGPALVAAGVLLLALYEALTAASPRTVEGTRAIA